MFKKFKYHVVMEQQPVGILFLAYIFNVQFYPWMQRSLVLPELKFDCVENVNNLLQKTLIDIPIA